MYPPNRKWACQIVNFVANALNGEKPYGQDPYSWKATIVPRLFDVLGDTTCCSKPNLRKLYDQISSQTQAPNF